MAKQNKSEMSDFFAESVPETLLLSLKDNTNFIITEDNNVYYIGMLLDTMKVGGFNKKSKNDQAKGSIIEYVKGGQIDAYITEDLNNSNKLLFIPTANTLDKLADYSIFTNLEYEFVKIDKSMNIVSFTGITAPYSKFTAILLGHCNIADFLSATPDETATPDESDETVVTETSHSFSDVTNKAKTIASDIVSAVATGANKVKEKVKEKTKEVTADMPDDESFVDVPNDDADTTIDDEQAQDSGQEIVYTETQVVSAVERIFHANNLDLPLSSEPFDQIFTVNNHLIRFDTDQRDGYVNNELNRMAADANRDLMKIRTDNIKKLRDKYFKIMSLRIEDIEKQLDVEDPTKQYGSLKDAILSSKNSKINSLAIEVEKRQAFIENAFESRIKEAEENAARQARADFKVRYQRQHNDDLNNVEPNIRADIQAFYTCELNELFLSRRSDALTILDMNITATLNELAKDYQILSEEENDFYMRAADKMREYSKELHVDDAKRLAIEEEHLRITNEVNNTRAEASAKIELLRREFEATSAALEAKTKSVIEQADATTALLKEQMNERTRELESDKQILQAQLTDSLDKQARAHEIAKADFEHRLEQAKDDAVAWQQTLVSYKEQHKHNNRLATILVAAITIACVAAGFIVGGLYWKNETNNNAIKQETTVVTEEQKDETSQVSEITTEPTKTTEVTKTTEKTTS